MFNLKDNRKVYFVGDINLQQNKLLMNLDIKKIKKSDIIILGNFGIINYSKMEQDKLSRINDKLILDKNRLFLLKGHLDNCKYFKKYKNFTNIKFIKNYDVLSLNNKNILFINDSEDYYRSISFNYKRNRPSLFVENNIPFKSINIVVSIDNVDFIYPYNYLNLKPFKKIDKWLYNDVKKKREKLTKIYELLVNTRKNKITHWISSRYNTNHIDKINNINFIQLKENQFFSI